MLLTLLYALGFAAAEPLFLWGAIHEHSSLSRNFYDVSPAQLYSRMITRAELDFGAVTDYDWSIGQTNRWDLTKIAANQFHCPTQDFPCYTNLLESFPELSAHQNRPFVTLLGYEWNNGSEGLEIDGYPMVGHRNIYWVNRALPDSPYGLEDGNGGCDVEQGCIPLIRSQALTSRSEDTGLVDPQYRSPCDLWSDMLGIHQRSAGIFSGMSIAHHVALSVTGDNGEALLGIHRPHSTDWSFHPSTCEGLDVPNHALETLVEMYSVWGSNEYQGMSLDEDPVDGIADPDRVVRDAALHQDSPHRLGFIASGDSHYGYPGEDPHHSYLLQENGQFRNYNFQCSPEANCSSRYGKTGLVGIWMSQAEYAEKGFNREQLWQALHQRRTVATTGSKIGLVTQIVYDDTVFAVQGEEETSGIPFESVLELEAQLPADERIAELSIQYRLENGGWRQHVLHEASGARNWSGQLPLSALIPPNIKQPQLPVVLYTKIKTHPRPAIRLTHETEVQIFDSTAEIALIRVPAGEYTSIALIDELQNRFEGANHQLVVSYDDDLFSLLVQDENGTPIDVRWGFETAPDLAYALGFRDDADAPYGEDSCTPCIAQHPVDGGMTIEQAWASPIWFRLAVPTQDTGTGSIPEQEPSSPLDTSESERENTSMSPTLKNGCGYSCGILLVLPLLYRRRHFI